ITPGDTLELWVDDIRLTSVVNDPGYAGQVGLNIAAADLGTFSINASRKDDNFRQLGEQPSFVTDNDVNLSSSIRLDKLLPRSLGLLLPVTVTHDRSGGDPHFLSGSDLLADAVPDVRTPSSSTTSYAIAVRRAARAFHLGAAREQSGAHLHIRDVQRAHGAADGAHLRVHRRPRLQPH